MFNHFASIIIFAFLSVFISGCFDEGSDSEMKRLSNALEKPIGYSPDYYLMKRTLGTGDPHPVILVFGYVDDLEVCQKIIDEAEERGLKKNMLFCQRANK